MKRQMIFAAVLIAGSLALYACRQRVRTKTLSETATDIASDAIQGNPAAGNEMKIALDRTKIEAIWFVVEDGETGAALSEDDVRSLVGYLAAAKYDTKLNDSGMAVKMTAPDYTLAVSHKDVAPDWVQIWIESGRTKYRTEWFNIRAEDLPAVAAILKKYK